MDLQVFQKNPLMRFGSDKQQSYIPLWVIELLQEYYGEPFAAEFLQVTA